jgi:hypothetical protein
MLRLWFVGAEWRPVAVRYRLDLPAFLRFPVLLGLSTLLLLDWIFPASWLILGLLPVIRHLKLGWFSWFPPKLSSNAALFVHLGKQAFIQRLPELRYS